MTKLLDVQDEPKTRHTKQQGSHQIHTIVVAKKVTRELEIVTTG